MSNSQWREVANGVALYRQKTSKFWWCRIKYEGDEYRFSTKATDYKEATEIAIEQKSFLRRDDEENILFKRKNDVGMLIDKTIENLLAKEVQKPTYSQYVQRLEQHIKPHFKKKGINQITYNDLEDYFTLKKLKSATTINTEKRAFNLLFNYALRNNYIDKEKIPDLPSPDRSRPKIRDYFDEEEIRTIFNHIDSWIDWGDKRSQPFRQNLKDQMELIHSIGLRPGDEVDNLCVKHLVKNSNRKVINETGDKNNWMLRIDTGKVQTEDYYRDVPLSISTMMIIEPELERIAEKVGIDPDSDNLVALLQKENGDEYLFRVDDKKPYTSKRFNQYKKWLKKHNIIELNEKQTLYSFRHSYITERLIKNDSLALIAKNCGTSILMIDRFYNSIRTELESHLLVNEDNQLFGEPEEDIFEEIN